MAGQLIYVVGPSGSGKDSIIQALANEADVTVMRRVITREPDSVGEVADSVDIETFDQMEADGLFSMSWRANGLSYGIPLSLDEHLQAGKVVVVFFGYVQCPDVCPTTLQELVEAKALLGAQGDRLSHMVHGRLAAIVEVT